MFSLLSVQQIGNIFQLSIHTAQGVYKGFFSSVNYRKGEKMKPNEKRV